MLLTAHSSGVEFGDRASLDALLAEICDGKMPNEAAPLVDGAIPGAERAIHSPIDGKVIGRVSEANEATAAAAMAAAGRAVPTGRRHRLTCERPRSNARAVSSKRGAAG